MKIRNPNDEVSFSVSMVRTMSIAFAEFESVTQGQRFVPHTPQTQPTLLHCLVVAENASRREFLQQQAQAAGWQVLACADASVASLAAHRFRQSLVIVDFDVAEPGSGRCLRALAEQLSADSQRLLIVCGTEGNPLEEIWARQLGVWLYLAGVDCSCDIESLCSAARQVVPKLQPPESDRNTPAYARTA